MLSPIKVALFAFIFFATVAFAIPAPTLDVRSQNPSALISRNNLALERALLPLANLAPPNATSDCVGPIIQETVEILAELINSLRLSSLSGCGCTGGEIVELLAITLKIILDPLRIVYVSYPNLIFLLGSLVTLVVELVQVTLALVGGLVGELVFFLIGNGCAGIILELKLGAIVHVLGLGGLLGHLL
ncbi:hypothetical protein F5148DRAFT_1282098 [Russula earlei]|uniref:Uncharacterized protein n=1 Tax=Russula earlei TaxID=71964 RepID=A0ACC0UH00_9AGAM|nr:hypothetical protein F5148DRAFT_1282098 [Russula earlei]